MLRIQICLGLRMWKICDPLKEDACCGFWLEGCAFAARDTCPDV